MSELDIPAFLRIPQEERSGAWRGMKLTKPASVKITRNEDASTRAFRRQIEKQEAAKKKAALDALHDRERAAGKRR